MASLPQQTMSAAGNPPQHQQHQQQQQQQQQQPSQAPAVSNSGSGYTPLKAARPITDLVFVVEATAVAGISMPELRDQYVVPLLESCSHPAMEWADLRVSCSFSLVTFVGSDCMPG